MAQVRLTKKGIVFLVFILVVASFGLGFGVWKITGLPNLAPTGSNAGDAGCGGLDEDHCDGSCSPITGKKKTSYQCKWKNGGCKETSKECGGSGGGDSKVCLDDLAKVPPVKPKCTLGATSCQEDAAGRRNGYNCTCVDVSTASKCIHDWNCKTYDAKACPPETELPPIVNDCGTVYGNCVKIKSALGTKYTIYTCPGMSYEEGKGAGCQKNGKEYTGNTICPGVAKNFCGWVQADIGGKPPTCQTSWYYDCEDGTTNKCEGGGTRGTAIPTSPKVGDKVNFMGFAYDADGVGTIDILKDGVKVGTASKASACGASGDTTICNKYKDKKPVIWKYVITVVAGTHNYKAVWSDTKGNAGAQCTLSTKITAQVTVVDNWEVTKVGAPVCLNDNTANAQAKINYTITIKNLATESKDIGTIVDTVDAKVLSSYISDVTPTGTVSGRVITWASGGTFTAGQSKTYTYSVTLPVATFGTYDNTVVVTPAATGSTPITVNESILATCTIPQEQDSWTVTKVGAPVCLNNNTANAQVRIGYTISVTNGTSTSRDITSVVDTLDAKIQSSYIESSSITPTGTVNGRVITWNPGGTYTAGETKTYRYSVLLPAQTFGTYDNTVVVTPASTSTPITVNESVVASCDVPNTGLFDSMISRVVLGFMLIGAGIAYLYYEPFNTLLNDALLQLSPRYSDKLERSRKSFEKRVVKK